jgi:hypothetical protein
LLAVPSNTLIRDLEIETPMYRGRGRRPERPFQRVDRWLASLPATAWTRIDVRDGEKGPLVIEAVQRCVQARSGRQVGPTETLFVTRELQADGQRTGCRRLWLAAFWKSSAAETTANRH